MFYFTCEVVIAALV